MVARNEALQIGSAVEKLRTNGYSVSPGMLPPELIASLAAEQRRREGAGELGRAGTGRGAGQAAGGTRRQAQSSWFNNGTAAERNYCAFAERIRLAINSRLFLGLFEFEAQFLHYPPGGFYRRHIDALQGERNRIVSMIAYLNEDWTRQDGGALSVWAAGGLSYCCSRRKFRTRLAWPCASAAQSRAGFGVIRLRPSVLTQAGEICCRCETQKSATVARLC
jgi:Rps23 Pro-64 3,4-dihydroxylase Tpa1-like proline 4-hydroxylase